MNLEFSLKISCKEQNPIFELGLTITNTMTWRQIFLTNIILGKFTYIVLKLLKTQQ